jgi:murein DD-endopeptidase MepM/ murein hydrolase activator NlpD
MHLKLYFFILLLFIVSPVHAQGVSAFCGVVDAIDYPIDGLVEGYDDFAMRRERFSGNHTGMDIGFDRWGDPVHAAADGRVTYADPEGWDTEKGVVILQHTFPDGSVAYSLYGHMEQTDTIFFPPVGSCVQRGEVVGAIGWPSRGRPHLHFEWRTFMPDDGGPGYVVDNPLDHGWYNPWDFTALWRARLTPAYVSSYSFDMVPSLPPIQSGGGYVIASSAVVTKLTDFGTVEWQVTTDGAVTGLAVLPGDRVAAHTETGQAVTLQNGRYLALWSVDGPDDPFLVFGETLIFPLDDGALASYNAEGMPLWSLPGETGGSIVHFAANAGQIALGVRGDEGVSWRQVDAAGGVLTSLQLDDFNAAAPLPDGSWLVLAGTELQHLTHGEARMITSVSPPPGRTARITADWLGNNYIYLGDADATLIAIGNEGNLRWRVKYPVNNPTLPPLLALGGGCLLYTMDADGMINVFSTADGTLLNQLQMYAGGRRNSSPGARLLRVDTTDQVLAGSGFLTMLTLDGTKMGGEAMANCLLG